MAFNGSRGPPAASWHIIPKRAATVTPAWAQRWASAAFRATPASGQQRPDRQRLRHMRGPAELARTVQLRPDRQHRTDPIPQATEHGVRRSGTAD